MTDLLHITVIDREMADRLAALFSAMSDPTRLRLLGVLSHHELNVTDLARAIDMSESATSHQLRLLRALRVVRSRKQGREVFYSLDDEHIHDLLDRATAHLTHE